MEQFESELQVAIAAVRKAAVVCQTVQSLITQEALEKKDRSPVTIADFASQAIVCRALADAFPDDPVVGEEDSSELKQSENAEFLSRIQDELAKTGLDADADQICSWIDHGNGESSDRFWTLDPIDGTKGFLRGQQYAISLALIVDGQIAVAALGCPNLSLDPNDENSAGSLFYAVRGHGAFVIPIDEGPFTAGEGRAVSVTTSSNWSDARLCESVESGHSSHSRSAQTAESLGIVKEPVRLDSQAKYAVVARGQADLYLRLPTRKDYREKIWDHAGGVLVVQEAGGTVTDVSGKPLDFTLGRELTQNRGVIVTNGPFHEGILEALAAAGVE